jgi:AraC family transcriptional regulator of arabinose operon
MSSLILKSERLALKYIYGSVVHYRPGDKLAPRVLNDFELVLMIEGTANYDLDGHALSAPRGSIILARPGFQETYTWDKTSTTRHAYVHFDIETVPSDWPSLGKWPVLIENPAPVIPSMLRHLLGRIAAHGERAWPSLQAWPEESLFMECLLGILLKPSGQEGLGVADRLPEQVGASLNLMSSILETNPHHPLQLGELAKRAGITEKHLCRLFQKALAHAPMETFRLLKLQLAMALLGRSSLAIKQIADRCGFENPLYFTRCFTRVYGKSPTEMRQSLLKQEAPPPNPLPPDIGPRIYW